MGAHLEEAAEAALAWAVLVWELEGGQAVGWVLEREQVEERVLELVLGQAVEWVRAEESLAEGISSAD